MSGDPAVACLVFIHCLHLLDRHKTDLVSLQLWHSVSRSHVPNLLLMPWGVCYVAALNGDSCPVGPALPSQLYAPVVLGSFGI